MNSNKRYAVFGLFNAVDVMGIKTNFPDGQWMIPVFDDYKKAIDYANCKFDVVELEIKDSK